MVVKVAPGRAIGVAKYSVCAAHRVGHGGESRTRRAILHCDLYATPGLDVFVRRTNRWIVRRTRFLVAQTFSRNMRPFSVRTCSLTSYDIPVLLGVVNEDILCLCFFHPRLSALRPCATPLQCQTDQYSRDRSRRTDPGSRVALPDRIPVHPDLCHLQPVEERTLASPVRSRTRRLPDRANIDRHTVSSR